MSELRHRTRPLIRKSDDEMKFQCSPCRRSTEYPCLISFSLIDSCYSDPFPLFSIVLRKKPHRSQRSVNLYTAWQLEWLDKHVKLSFLAFLLWHTYFIFKQRVGIGNRKERKRVQQCLQKALRQPIGSLCVAQTTIPMLLCSTILAWVITIHTSTSWIKYACRICHIDRN